MSNLKIIADLLVSNEEDSQLVACDMLEELGLLRLAKRIRYLTGIDTVLLKTLGHEKSMAGNELNALWWARVLRSPRRLMVRDTGNDEFSPDRENISYIKVVKEWNDYFDTYLEEADGEEEAYH